MENPKFTVCFPFLCFLICLASASVVCSDKIPVDNRKLILIVDQAKQIFRSNTAMPDAADSSATAVSSDKSPVDTRKLILIVEQAKQIFRNNTAMPDIADSSATVVSSDKIPVDNRKLILIENHAKSIFGSSIVRLEAADSSDVASDGLQNSVAVMQPSNELIQSKILCEPNEEGLLQTIAVQIHEEEMESSAESIDFISPPSELNEQYQHNESLCGWNFPNLCFYTGYMLGKGVGYSRGGYASIGLLATSWQSQDKSLQPFVDIRGHILNNSKKAANIGIGALYYSSHLNIVVGGNIYYDFREGKHADYNQIGIGAEVFGSCWDFRINGYLPVGRRQSSSSTLFDHYKGGFFAICTKEERSLAGFDAELGYYIRKRDPCNPCDFDFYVAIGPYYFSKASCNSDIFGGLARFRASWLNCINVELIASSDHVFHDRVQARFEFCIPLGDGWKFWENEEGSPCSSRRCLRGICCQRVRRREIIAIKNSCRWCTNWGSSADSSCRISQCGSHRHRDTEQQRKQENNSNFR